MEIKTRARPFAEMAKEGRKGRDEEEEEEEVPSNSSNDNTIPPVFGNGITRKRVWLFGHDSEYRR